MKKPTSHKDDMETAGSLTPELNLASHSHAHPFRYAGQDPEGAPPRGVEEGSVE